MGSIKKNGIYEQIVSSIGEKIVFEYGGILPNPTYEICLSLVQSIDIKKINFILAVGGGSVIDAAKYISVLSCLKDYDSAWEIVDKRLPVENALPLAVVLTCPGSGSEMNSNAVISNVEKTKKITLKSDKIYPMFSILDPEVINSLSSRQIANGIVDAYSHVLEQYLTSGRSAPLQDRFAESILITLLEIGFELVRDPHNYELQACFMWASTSALNGFLACGGSQDWATHIIGHELTMEYKIPHAETISILLPGVMTFLKDQKKNKLIQYGRRVFSIEESEDELIVKKTIAATEKFFISLGQKVRLSDYGIGEKEINKISNKIGSYPRKIGENKDIGEKEVNKILLLRE